MIGSLYLQIVTIMNSLSSLTLNGIKKKKSLTLKVWFKGK